MASTSKAFNKCVDPCPRYLRWHTQSLRLLFGQGARTRCPWGENLCATSSTFAGRRHMIGKVVTGCVAILSYHTKMYTGSWIWVSRFRFHIAYRYSPSHLWMRHEVIWQRCIRSSTNAIYCCVACYPLVCLCTFMCFGGDVALEIDLQGGLDLVLSN